MFVVRRDAGFLTGLLEELHLLEAALLTRYSENNDGRAVAAADEQTLLVPSQVAALHVFERLERQVPSLQVKDANRGISPPTQRQSQKRR